MMYNQNSQIIQESSNVVIYDNEYDQEIIESQILIQKSIGDNPKYVEITKDNLEDILERNINPNKDESILQEDTSEEMRNMLGTLDYFVSMAQILQGACIYPQGFLDLAQWKIMPSKLIQNKDIEICNSYL